MSQEAKPPRFDTLERPRGSGNSASPFHDKTSAKVLWIGGIIAAISLLQLIGLVVQATSSSNQEQGCEDAVGRVVLEKARLPKDGVLWVKDFAQIDNDQVSINGKRPVHLDAIWQPLAAGKKEAVITAPANSKDVVTVAIKGASGANIELCLKPGESVTIPAPRAKGSAR